MDNVRLRGGIPQHKSKFPLCTIGAWCVYIKSEGAKLKERKTSILEDIALLKHEVNFWYIH